MPGPGRNRKAIAKPKNVGKILKRLIKYMSMYRFRLIIVGALIIISSLAGVAGNYFLKPVINNYIVPYIGKENPDLSGLVSILILMGAIYLVGVSASYIYARIMINISTGTLKRMRTDLFSHMESLPIKYFHQLHPSHFPDMDTDPSTASHCSHIFLNYISYIVRDFNIDEIKKKIKQECMLESEERTKRAKVNIKIMTR